MLLMAYSEDFDRTSKIWSIVTDIIKDQADMNKYSGLLIQADSQ